MERAAPWLLVRIWSDGYSEYKSLYPCCVNPPYEWTEIPANPAPPDSVNVGLTVGYNNNFYRVWADGSTDNVYFLNNNDGNGFLTIGWYGTQPPN